LLEDVFAVYFKARRHKRNTVSQLAFEMNREANLIDLCIPIDMLITNFGQSNKYRTFPGCVPKISFAGVQQKHIGNCVGYVTNKRHSEKHT